MDFARSLSCCASIELNFYELLVLGKQYSQILVDLNQFQAIKSLTKQVLRKENYI